MRGGLKVKKILCIILIIFSCSIMWRTDNKVKAEDVPIVCGDEIRILEIEPGNLFRLSNKSEITRDEVINKGTIIQSSDKKSSFTLDRQVKITHITMAEFISMVDEISGQYDIVTVGRENNGLESHYNKDKPYRDYTNPSSQLMYGLRYAKSGNESSFASQNENPKKLADDRNYVEYYAENDITKKRCDEILKMIKSNQLVYMDSKIFNSNDNDTSKAITGTNLYKMFNKDTNESLKQYENYKIENSNSISLFNIISDYNNLDEKLKRPIVQVTKPLDDASSDKAELYKRLLDFKIKSNKGEKLKINIYLDINADGLFKQNELYKSKEITFTSSNDEETVSCNLDKEFIGYLDWKVEIIRENTTNNIVSHIKTNVISSSQFKPIDKKRTIRVLQINPLTKNDTSNLYLDNNTNFNELFKDVKDYDIKIDCISYQVFNQTLDAINDVVNVSSNNRQDKISNLENSIASMKDIEYKRSIQSIIGNLNNGGNLNEIPNILNGSYDMVIIGFADSYGKDNEFSDKAINQLDSFARTGQSVMFTHDTMSMNSIEGNNINRGPMYLTRHFRDYLGQSIYKDPLKLKSKENISQDTIDDKDIYKESVIIRDSNGNIIDSDLNDKEIEHRELDLNSDDELNKRYSLGTTLKSIQWDTTKDTSIKKINGAQISEYPFKLNSTMSVAETHIQWYQLNLEDPDVVPWYNLNSDNRKDSNAFDDKDSKNYFYTYSRGNLTYSGTGHSNGYTTDEFKLFINTIIKAERGANHAPEIKSSIVTENIEGQAEKTNKVIVGSNYIFTVDADDLEHEFVDMHISVDGTELTAENIDVDLTEREGNGTTEKIFKINTADSSRNSVSITIPKSKLSDIGKKVAINIDATDRQGAKSKKSYILEVTNATVLNFESYLNKLTVKDATGGVIEEKAINKDQTIQDNIVNIKDNQYLNAEYKIEIEDNPINDISGGTPKEVAILIDRSMDSGALTQNQNGLINSIIKNSRFIKNDDTSSIKFSILPYNKGQIKDYVNDLKLGNGPNDWAEEGIKKLCQEGTISQTEPNSEGLGIALKKAEAFFENNNEPTAGKTIVIISKTNLNLDMNDEKFQELLNGINNINYNVVSVGISDKGYNNLDDDKTKLRELHKKLGGSESTFYISSRDGDSGNTHNDLESAVSTIVNKSIMERVADDLVWIRSNIFSTDVKLKFDLGKDIIPTESSNLIKSSNGNPTEYYINIGQLRIKANYYIDKDGNIIASEDSIDELLSNVLDTIDDNENGQAKIVEDELKDMLNERLKKILVSPIESRDLKPITELITQKLKTTIKDLNLTGGEINDKLLKDIDKSKTVKEILKSNTTIEVKNAMKDILKIGVNDKLNEIIKPKINSSFLSEIYYNSIDNNINFNIKPADKTSTDILQFTPGKNKLVFTDALKNMQEYKIVKNPILQMDKIKIDHGLYGGLSDEQDLQFGCIRAIISNKNNNSDYDIAKESIVTLASNINGITSKIKIVLTVDNEVSITESPKVYRVILDDSGKSKLEKIYDFGDPSIDVSTGKNIYTINEFDGATCNNIIILYSAKGTNTFTNTIKASSKEAEVTIKNDAPLPDLF